MSEVSNLMVAPNDDASGSSKMRHDIKKTKGSIFLFRNTYTYTNTFILHG